MKYNQSTSTWRGALLALFLIVSTAIAFGQNIVITDSASFSGGGTINIKGDLIDSATTAKSITGTTVFHGDGTAQFIGKDAAAGATLTFDSLKVDSAGIKTLNTPVTVAGKLDLALGNLAVAGRTLNIDGAATKSGGTLTANVAGDTVQYRGTTGTQTIVDAAYRVLNLKNTVGISLLNPASAETVNHTGSGGLTVNKKFTVNAAATLNTITDATDTLLIGGTGSNSINIITTTSAGGLISNGSTGALGITTVSGNGGTISTGAGALNVGALTANAGTIKTTAGAVTFAGAMNNTAGNVTAANGGSLAFNGATTNGGTVKVGASSSADFATAVTNTGTIQVDTGSATFNANFAAAGTLTFDSLSHATYAGTADSIESTTYGSLVLNGPPSNGAKGSFTLKDTLRLGSHKLYMKTTDSVTYATQTGDNVVNDTAGEVIGKVNRTNAFVANMYYAFNKDSVGFAVDSLLPSPNVTINMQPGDTFKTPAPSVKYVKRYFGFTGNVGTARLKTLSLAYAQNEVQPTVTSELKLGLRSDNAGAWAKVSNPGGYTRNVDSANNIVLATNLLSPLAGVSEFGIINTAFVTKVNGQPWIAGATWDEGSKPDSTDDAEVNNTGITVGGAGAYASSLVINAGKQLTVDNPLKIYGDVDNFGSLSVNGPDTLTLASLNHSGTALTNAGTINMSGKFRVHGPVNNSGTINVGQ